MAVCEKCNAEMIDNIKTRGQHPFEIGVDGRSDLFVDVPTGERKTNFLGIEYEEVNSYKIKARMCPKCNKIELYAEKY